VLLVTSRSELCGLAPKVSDFGLSVKMATMETHVSKLCQVSALLEELSGGRALVEEL
jgi:hypothetical protein